MRGVSGTSLSLIDEQRLRIRIAWTRTWVKPPKKCLLHLFFQRDMVPSVFPTEELLRGRNLKGEMKRQSRSIVAEGQHFVLRTSKRFRGRWRIVPVDLCL
jgi:hypothetical protein